MQIETEHYLDTLCGQIRWKKARRLVREELQGHIEEKKKEGESNSMDIKEAEIKAVKSMGDPVETGKMMDKLHRPKTDILMVISMAVLMLFGLAVFTMSVISYNLGIKHFFELISVRPELILFMVIGIAAFILCLFVNLRWLLKKNIFIIISGVVGIAGLLFINLTSTQHRFWAIPNDWLSFISYICIGLLVISFAAILLRLQKKSWATAIFAAGVTLSVAAILLFRENAPRVIAMFLLISMIIMVWCTNIKMPWKIIASAAMASIVLIYLLNHSLLNNMLFHPERMNMLSEGETAVLKERLMHVQIFGQAPGATEWLDSLYLVSVNIMVYVLLKFGILPSLILLTALGVLVWRLVRACARMRDVQGRVLAAGLTAFISIAITGTILLNLLFIGTSGTYMPFQGNGPEFVLYSAFLGLIAGLYRSKGLYTAKDTLVQKNAPAGIETA